MKKFVSRLLLVAIAAGFAATASAQEASNQKWSSPKPPKRYINIAYDWQKIDSKDAVGDNQKSEWGAGMEFGTTYFLHPKPIVGMIRIGLDFTYLDLQYNNYREEVAGKVLSRSHFTSIGMQLGPSVTVSPIPRLHAKAYLRYSPTFSGYFSKTYATGGFLEDTFTFFGGYGSYITTGLSASYSVATIGVEWRWGGGNLHKLDVDGEADITTEKVKVKFPSTRLFVGFRF